MSEAEKILDAVAILQDFGLAQSGDNEAKKRLKERKELPAGIKAWVEKPEAPPKQKEEAPPPPPPAPKPAPAGSMFKKPSKDDFKDEDEYKKAEKAYVEFVTDVRSQIEGPLGESIKRTIVPPGPPKETIDYGKMLKDADDSVDFREFMHKVGLKE